MDKRAIVKEAVGLTIVAVLLALVSNVVASPKRHLKWIGDMPTLEPQLPTQDEAPVPAAPTFVRIETERAHAEWSAGTVFLDARTTDAFYDDGHIAGALPMAVWEGDIDDKVVNLMGEFPLEQCFVIYCTGGTCEDSDLLAERLLAAGFNDLLVYQGGYPAWIEAGHPVE